jgi:sodium/hydrogen exchanger 8
LNDLGLRGALAFSLTLHMPTTAENVIQTTTLMIVVFTVLVLGGGTVPTLKLLKIKVSLKNNKRTILVLFSFCFL